MPPRPRPAVPATAEHGRLAESPDDSDAWRLWGPYVSARQWGTVREDYSGNGDAWGYFPFDHAHQRAYRWGEDGLAGVTDRFGFLNLSFGAWNGQDDRLKERLFGLTNPQGNHGEDVKEYWWSLDATPTHSYASWLYRYPQAAFPYAELVQRNAERGFQDREFELADTGVLAENRFFDVVVTHAKASPEDLCMTITATNHGPEAAPLHLVPQLWFRNTWAWGRDDRMPSLRRVEPPEHDDGDLVAIEAQHGWLGTYRFFADDAQGADGSTRIVPRVLFCNNETNDPALYGQQGRSAYPKDAVNQAVVHGDDSLVNPAGRGTKVGLHYDFGLVGPGESVTVRVRLKAGPVPDRPFGAAFTSVVERRREEADAFYREVIPASVSDERRHIARRGFAGLLWGKQLYRYNVEQWLEGDPAFPPPPSSRLAPEHQGRNTSWRHLALADVISMPDEWEYPWFAAWDLAFHCVALARIDPAFAKEQLLLICREWAQHPDGQLPAYEWAFSDVNPPVHAWAAWRVFEIDGKWDHGFLKRIVTKLLLNFGWWVNRKDQDGSNLFEGGFLGLDNIGLFDRSNAVPQGWKLEQADATSWMGFFCIAMLRMSLQLAREDDAWDDVATTFLERFLAISTAMETGGTHGVSLWHEEDGFYYDALIAPDGGSEQIAVRSLVGLLPLLGVALAPRWVPRELPDFTERLAWLQRHRPEQTDALILTRGPDNVAVTVMLTSPDRHRRLVRRMIDESEFLSQHGIRSMSAAYRSGYSANVAGVEMSLSYVPGESDSGLFGGNSNWRGPIWFPINVLLIDSLRVYADGAGSQEQVEFPRGSGEVLSLHEVADRIEDRLISLFEADDAGRRPGDPHDQGSGPLWSEHPFFCEYFDGDTGEGLGATHQTGWTALVAHLICEHVERSLSDGSE
ncbi:MAG: glucosidase [Dermatophilaceae bacterium]